MQVVAARAEIVVDEYRVGLLVFQKLRSDLLRMAHPVRHAKALSRQIAEAAAVVAPAGSDQAGGGKKPAAGDDRAPRRWVVAIIVLIRGYVARLQAALLDVVQDSRPELDSIAEREGVRMRRAFFGAR